MAGNKWVSLRLFGPLFYFFWSYFALLVAGSGPTLYTPETSKGPFFHCSLVNFNGVLAKLPVISSVRRIVVPSSVKVSQLRAAETAWSNWSFRLSHHNFPSKAGHFQKFHLYNKNKKMMKRVGMTTWPIPQMLCCKPRKHMASGRSMALGDPWHWS